MCFPSQKRKKSLVISDGLSNQFEYGIYDIDKFKFHPLSSGWIFLLKEFKNKDSTIYKDFIRKYGND